MHLDSNKFAKTIIDLKPNSTAAPRPLLNLDPGRLLLARLKNPADREALLRQAKRYLRLTLRAGDVFEYENDLGAFVPRNGA